jgi:hypothetical protein
MKTKTPSAGTLEILFSGTAGVLDFMPGEA